MPMGAGVLSFRGTDPPLQVSTSFTATQPP